MGCALGCFQPFRTNNFGVLRGGLSRALSVMWVLDVVVARKTSEPLRGGLRDPCGGEGHHAVGGPKAAPRHRALLPAEAPDALPGRGHLRPGRGERGESGRSGAWGLGPGAWGEAKVFGGLGV